MYQCHRSNSFWSSLVFVRSLRLPSLSHCVEMLTLVIQGGCKVKYLFLKYTQIRSQAITSSGHGEIIWLGRTLLHFKPCSYPGALPTDTSALSSCRVFLLPWILGDIP